MSTISDGWALFQVHDHVLDGEQIQLFLHNPWKHWTTSMETPTDPPIQGLVTAVMTPAKWDMAAFRAKFEEMARRQAAQREAELAAERAESAADRADFWDRIHSKRMEE